LINIIAFAHIHTRVTSSGRVQSRNFEYTHYMHTRMHLQTYTQTYISFKKYYIAAPSQ